MKKNFKKFAAFTIVEIMMASLIALVAITATLNLLFYARTNNELEQERTRAFQIISQKLDVETYKLFTWTQSDAQVTIWDNATPDDPNDDTRGLMEIIVRDPDTRQVLNAVPNPARMVEVEATIRWKHRGPRPNRLMSETVITTKVP